MWINYCDYVKELRLCETSPSPPALDPVGIENCKQLFSPLLAFTTQKIATINTDIISAVCVAFFWVVSESRNEKSCLQFLILTAVFHMLLTNNHCLCYLLLIFLFVYLLLWNCDVCQSGSEFRSYISKSENGNKFVHYNIFLLQMVSTILVINSIDIKFLESYV